MGRLVGTKETFPRLCRPEWKLFRLWTPNHLPKWLFRSVFDRVVSARKFPLERMAWLVSQSVDNRLRGYLNQAKAARVSIVEVRKWWIASDSDTVYRLFPPLGTKFGGPTS